MEYIGLDFETYGSRNLTKVGLDNYINDPSFKPLIASINYLDLDGLRQRKTFDFIDPQRKLEDLEQFKALIQSGSTQLFAAHNAGFERAVLKRMGFPLPNHRFIDTAVIARIMGADSSLENSSKQLLDKEKMEVGKRLIQKFSIARADGTALVDDPDWDPTQDSDWQLNKDYCENDAELAVNFVLTFENLPAFWQEARYEPLTAGMNQSGWPVDRESVQLMLDRAEQNKLDALTGFRMALDPEGKLNLNSLKQLKEWCRTRGIQASSFDEAHVESLIQKITARLCDPHTKLALGVRENYGQVLDMLHVKKVIGGSSLSKLPKIQLLTGKDGRLRDQYMHCGAGQTYRTSGRGVQMQNLKRLHSPKDMSTLADPTVHWTNDELAENIRQCFTASTPNGRLIVGDLASIESRGLAYMAGAEWKLENYRQGKDMYKVLGAKIYAVPYDYVDKTMRTTGKVGELSCGYGAGPVAVHSFAKGMHVDMDEQAALALVRDWRAINPEVEALWLLLNTLLHSAVSRDPLAWQERTSLANGLAIEFVKIVTPVSLEKMHPGAQSLEVHLYHNGSFLLSRVFHGCYRRGRNICYYKPAERKTGELWKAWYMDPKTKQRRFYDIYGGKLVGILVQSFCREIFFKILDNVQSFVLLDPGLDLIGQFHDEIVLDWNPAFSKLSLEEAKHQLHLGMSDPMQFTGFPMAAEVKSDYRYTK